MKTKRFILAAVGGLSLLAAASAAHADTIVEATTSGVINPATAGGVTITFTGASLDTDAPTLGTTFGTFNVSGVGSSTTTFNSTFTLTVLQYNPSSDTGTIGGDVTGTVSYYHNLLHLTVTGGSLTLGGGTFGGNVISPVTYTLFDGNIGNNIGADSSFSATVYGSIDFTSSAPGPAVPLPASVLGGSALLGGLYLAKAYHRKRSS